MIRYKGWTEYEPIYRYCPRFNQGEDIYAIYVYVQSPSNPDPIEKTAEIFNLDMPEYPDIQTLYESAGLTPEDFYHLFMDDSQEACFTTPQDIWP